MRHLAATARPIAEDLAGTLVFYLLFALMRSLLLSVGAGLLLGLGQVVRHRMRRERVPALLSTGLVLTAVLGGVTAVTRDPRIVMLKPTILYLCLSATMLPRGWIRRYLPEIARDLLPGRTLDRLGWSWAALMGTSAMLNLHLVTTLPPVRAATLFSASAIGSKLLLFAAQYAAIRPVVRRAYMARTATLERAAPLP